MKVVLDMIKQYTELVRFDYTDECRSCKFRKDLGLLEYCCSFVYDLIYEKKLLQLKRNVVDYILDESLLEKMDYSKVLFNEDTFTLTVKLKTNLKDSYIKSELERILNESIYFTGVMVE